MTRVLIATDEPVRAKGLESVLRAGGLEIAAVCHDVAELFDCFHWCRPEIAVIDLRVLPTPEVIHDLHRLRPQCQFVEWPELTLSDSLARFAEAIRKLASSPWPSPSKSVALVCTPSERELVTLVGFGLSNEEIAAVLGADRSTVQKLLSSLSGRLGTDDRCELALYGLSMLNEPDNRNGGI
jgi:DNA-binding NarL/FixJ family response regulator